jgi:Holliday junction resolvase
MLTPERKVKTKVTKLLTERGAYWFYPVASGYGSAGIPDIVCCYRGKFIGIECKAGSGRTTALQENNLERIRLCKGFALVVREDLTELIAILDFLDGKSHCDD